MAKKKAEEKKVDGKPEEESVKHEEAELMKEILGE